MVAGIVAGPTGLRVISSPEDVEMLAELGVVLLLFTVGLDFSTTGVQQIWKPIVIGGVLQIAGTALALAGGVLLAGDWFHVARHFHWLVRRPVEHGHCASRDWPSGTSWRRRTGG